MKFVKFILSIVVLAFACSFGFAWYVSGDVHQRENALFDSLNKSLEVYSELVSIEKVEWEQGWWKDRLVIEYKAEGKVFARTTTLVEHGLFPFHAMRYNKVSPMIAFAETQIQFIVPDEIKSEIEISRDTFNVQTQFLFANRIKNYANVDFHLKSMNEETPVDFVIKNLNVVSDIVLNSDLNSIKESRVNTGLEQLSVLANDVLSLDIKGVSEVFHAQVKDGTYAILNDVVKVDSTDLAIYKIDSGVSEDDIAKEEDFFLNIKNITSKLDQKLIDDAGVSSTQYSLSSEQVSLNDINLGPNHSHINIQGLIYPLYSEEVLAISMVYPDIMLMTFLENMRKAPVSIDLKLFDFGSEAKDKLTLQVTEATYQLPEEIEEGGFDHLISFVKNLSVNVQVGKDLLNRLEKSSTIFINDIGRGIRRELTDINENFGDYLILNKPDQYSIHLQLENKTFMPNRVYPDVLMINGEDALEKAKELFN